MTSVTHLCADTAADAARNDAARLKALALAALVEHPAVRTLSADDLVTAASSAAPAPTLART
jgi:hypothetical protein